MLGQGTFLFWCARAPARALDADQLLQFPRDALQDKPSPDVGGLPRQGSLFGAQPSSGLARQGSLLGALSSLGLARLRGSLAWARLASRLTCQGWVVGAGSWLARRASLVYVLTLRFCCAVRRLPKSCMAYYDSYYLYSKFHTLN